MSRSDAAKRFGPNVAGGLNPSRLNGVKSFTDLTTVRLGGDFGVTPFKLFRRLTFGLPGRGGTFDWNKVSEAEMRALSEKMFDAANVPANVRQDYWAEFKKMKAALRN